MALKTWRELPIGCVVSEPGSASEYHTGSWRSQRPIWKNAEMYQMRHLLCILSGRMRAADGRRFFSGEYGLLQGLRHLRA